MRKVYMMQGGMMGSNMGPHPYMMSGLSMPTTSTMGRNTGINPSIPRPNLMASQSMGGGPHGPGHGHTPGQLTCSMSMPVGSGGMGPGNSMSPNQFPMQGNASGGQYPGQGGGTPNQMMTRMLNSSMPQNTSMTQSNAMPVGSGGMGPGNSMSPNEFLMQGNASGGQYPGQGGGTPNQMMTRMLNSSMPENTSMTQSNAMGNRWGNNAPPSTAGQSSQQMYPTPVTTQAPSMGQDMFTGGGNGGMNRRNIYFQGMMGQQQRGPGNQNAPVTSQQNQDNQDPDGKGTTLLQKLLFE